MQTTYEYIALFIEPQQLYTLTAPMRTNPLPRRPQHPHVTFAFHPDEVDETLFGIEVPITITAYGNDGKNEGVFVTTQIENERLKTLFKRIPVPHITLAIADGAHAVNTKKLNFAPVSPVTVKGIFGGCLAADGQVVLH